ncbi:hypothetical protein [Pedobacter sp. JCM 36344]
MSATLSFLLKELQPDQYSTNDRC